MEPLQIVGTVAALMAAVAGVIRWHFNEINKVKTHVTELEMKMKDLERTDALQQQALDQFQGLIPMLNTTIKALAQKKKA